jgi:hypothetical protein
LLRTNLTRLTGCLPLVILEHTQGTQGAWGDGVAIRIHRTAIAQKAFIAISNVDLWLKRAQPTVFASLLSCCVLVFASCTTLARCNCVGVQVCFPQSTWYLAIRSENKQALQSWLVM